MEFEGIFLLLKFKPTLVLGKQKIYLFLFKNAITNPYEETQ